jgi:hypothetical protein
VGLPGVSGGHYRQHRLRAEWAATQVLRACSLRLGRLPPPQPWGSGTTQERPAIRDLRQRTLASTLPRAHVPAADGRRVHRRHLSPATRAALAHTRELQIDLGNLLWLGLATSPSEHEAPVRVHPLRAAMPRIELGVDALVAIAPPGRAPVHPSLRQLGNSAAGYLRARRWWRRWYLTRQLAYGVLVAGVVAATPILVLGAGDANGRLAASTANGIDTHSFDDVASVTPHTARAVASPRAATPAPAVVASTGAVFQGAWVNGVRGRWFVPYPASPNTGFLACTRSHESDTAGGYRAIDPPYRHFGAYQFLQSTWNNVARKTGRTWLVGVNPAQASPRDQDWMALYLYRWLGASHWQGRCAGT